MEIMNCPDDERNNVTLTEKGLAACTCRKVPMPGVDTAWAADLDPLCPQHGDPRDSSVGHLISEYVDLQREHPSIKLTTEGGYILLAMPCIRCKTKGYERGEPCDLCNTRGYVMTPDGLELARFVRVFGSSLFGEPERKGPRVNNAGGPNGEAFR